MSNDKKYFYITENTDVVKSLSARGIFHIWGGVDGTESVTHPGVLKYLVCVDWASRMPAERMEFESQEHVTPLPHKHSQKPVSAKAMTILKECTKASGQHAITDGDHTHDIIEKLTGHTGWPGWWPHL